MIGFLLPPEVEVAGVALELRVSEQENDTLTVGLYLPKASRGNYLHIKTGVRATETDVMVAVAEMSVEVGKKLTRERVRKLAFDAKR